MALSATLFRCCVLYYSDQVPYLRAYLAQKFNFFFNHNLLIFNTPFSATSSFFTLPLDKRQKMFYLCSDFRLRESPKS